ncbi:hypothetical protein [Pantanalinema sp. GBBB05]
MFDCGSDNQVRVIYDRGTDRVTVSNKVAEDEFCNYQFMDVDEGTFVE